MPSVDQITHYTTVFRTALLNHSEQCMNSTVFENLARRFSRMVFVLVRILFKGIARTQSPTIKNYALELPTFGVIVGVNQTVVQWKGLTLEEPPS